MGATVAHRGPDSEGTYLDARLPVGFAHRRLAILDLTPNGHQPMTSCSGRFVVTYNGELYNYRELAAQVGAPALASDTAVLLACVERFGVAESLKRFNGMFAFALLDREAKAVHLVRDRFGEKPLYVAELGNGVHFASELRAIEAVPGISLEIDPDAVEELLRFKCIGGHRTIYRDVIKLLPGHHLTIDANTAGRKSLERYWAPPMPFDEGSGEASLEELDSALEASVRMRLRADVPVGALLSGGVDSAVVSTIAAAHHSELHTFTAGVGDPDYDERAQARAVATALGTQHHEIEITEGDLLALVTDLPSTYDEPYADSSAIPTLALMRFVRSEVKVALTGDGGDELFGGYPRYRLAPLTWSVARALPSALVSDRAETMARVLDHFERLSPRFPRSLRERSLDWVAGLLAASSGATSFAEHYRNVRSDTHSPASLLHQRWQTPDGTDAGEQVGYGNHLAAMMHDDLLNYLPDDILVKVDRAAMSVGLETRVPMLDADVLEVAWRLPLEVGVGENRDKAALREILARRLPGVSIPREKRGFGVPLAGWLRGPLREWAEDLLSVSSLERVGLLDAAAVRTLWQRHQSGKNLHHPLWAILALQAWTLQRTGSVTSA